MSSVRRVFVAGTIQGASNGLAVEDQGYRQVIPTIVSSVFPQAECFDPSGPVLHQLADQETAAAVRAVIEAGPRVLRTSDLVAEGQRLRRTFLDMTEEAARCDLCIAYLPGSTPSMGTAMEMYAARRAGVPVIAVTRMTGNLAVVAVSTVIAPDLESLRDALIIVRDGITA
jgi:hypothetical protein